MKKDKVLLKTHGSSKTDILLPPPEEKIPPGKTIDDMPLSKYHALDQDGLAMPGSKVANGHAWCYKAVPVDTADIAPLSGGEEACKFLEIWRICCFF
jgi:hypothetical protein